MPRVIIENNDEVGHVLPVEFAKSCSLIRDLSDMEDDEEEIIIQLPGGYNVDVMVPILHWHNLQSSNPLPLNRAILKSPLVLDALKVLNYLGYERLMHVILWILTENLEHMESLHGDTDPLSEEELDKLIVAYPWILT